MPIGGSISDLKLFRTDSNGTIEIHQGELDLEKSLQKLIERDLEVILGVRPLASEYVTGKAHAGRIDTLGIDENSCPVIIEYKRSISESVINQGLYYLDWLMDHKADVQLLVMQKQGEAYDKNINWSGTRLICIAADFTKFDVHAVEQIDRNIELIRFRKFDGNLLLIDLVNTVTAKFTNAKISKISDGIVVTEKTWDDYISELKPPISELFDSLRLFLLHLGDDVSEKRLSLYIAFKRLRNFACIEFRKDKILLYVKLDPETVSIEEGFSRDVRNIGHWGTGDLELTVSNEHSLAKAKLLLARSYAES